MSNFISVFLHFLTSIVSCEIFLYVLAAFSLYAVIQLVRRAVYG